MDKESERRAPGSTRVPFEALVEMSPSLGPSFEAQAVDLSDEGMHLRTAYLPEVGQDLACRFDAGTAGEVYAQCEVLWKQEGELGGEFGLRFVDLDPKSAEALGSIVGVPLSEKVIQRSGAKVRLHIEGLGFPMKARVKDASRKQLTVGNELGFLQVGKQLDLEDAETGQKRPASIDHVEVEIDPASRVPRLVVGLRYADESESIRVDAPEPAPKTRPEKTPEPIVTDHRDDALPKVDAYAPERPAAKITPTLRDWAHRARVAAGVLWEKRAARARERAEAAKRTTAPPPGGGLHASGRKVVRGLEATPARPKLDMKRKLVLGGATGFAVVLAFAALHKPKTESAQQEKPAESANALAATPPPSALPPAPPPPPPVASAEPAPSVELQGEHHGHHATHVASFGAGAVTHGNVLKLRMDGPIEKINGAAQPTGFTVSLPNRRALEPAGPLAARDGRIASIKVTNDGAGSQLDVTFKDGVPGYLVRAKGDTLELVLAAPGHLETDKTASKKKKNHKN